MPVEGRTLTCGVFGKKAASTSLRWLTVLNVLPNYASARQAARASPSPGHLEPVGTGATPFAASYGLPVAFRCV